MQHKIDELIDIPTLQQLTDTLYQVSSIPASLVDMDGQVLTGSGWQRVCTEFHRQDPVCARQCIASDTRSRSRLKEGEPFVVYQCPHGLIDAAAPVVVDGQHLANILSGQVLFEPIDLAKEQAFRAQARKYGFDETAYLQAVREVPVLDQGRFEQCLSFLAQLSGFIASLGQSRLKEQRLRKGLQAEEGRLRRLNLVLQTIQEVNQVLVHADRPRILLSKAIAALIRTGAYRRAWVLLMDGRGEYQTSLAAGLKNIFPRLRPLLEQGKWPSCLNRALGSKGLVITRQPRQQCSSCPLARHSPGLGTFSVPLGYRGQVLGALVVSLETRFIEESQEQALFSELAADISFALNNIRVRARDRQVSRQLKESKGLYRALYENSLIGIGLARLSGRIVEGNPAFARILGYEPGELTGLDVSRLYQSPGERKALKRIIEHQGSLVGHQTRLRRKDGSLAEVLLDSTKIRLQGRSYYQTSCLDISALKGAERRLRASEKDYRNLFHNAQVGLFRTRIEDGLVLECNIRFAEMFGFKSRGQVINHFMTSANYVDPGTRERMLREIRAKNEIDNFEARIYRKDNSVLWLLYSARIYPEKGYIEGVAEDVSALKEKEASLRLSQERYKNLFENSPESIALIAASGQFLTVNPAMARVLGVKPSDLEGRDLAQVLPEDVAARQMAKGRKAIETDKLVYFKDERNGRSFEHYCVRFPGAQDRQVFQDIARDITAVDKTRQRLQKTLSSLNRAVCGTFRTLALALEQRDPYTAGHQERVAQLAKAIALRLGLGSKRIQGLYFAGLVHDIGKISIPAAILAKPSDLLEAEFALIREHPRIGWEILKNTEFPWPVAEVVLEHHERLNGSGYPQGLMGEEIRLEARILAVADVVEAMSSHRPYRAGHGLEAALREIEVNKGILFDVQVAEACLDLFREERFSFEHLEYWAASIKDLER